MLRQLGPRRPPASFQIRKRGKDSEKPSMRPIRTPLRPTGPSPPRSRVADLPSSGSLISASLEGSGSTLERVTHLRLARGLPPGPSTERVASLRLARGQRTCPRAGGQSPPRSRPSLGTRDKQPRRPTARRTKALKASHSATAQRTGGVRLPLPQWR